MGRTGALLSGESGRPGVRLTNMISRFCALLNVNCVSATLYCWMSNPAFRKCPLLTCDEMSPLNWYRTRR
jgi:hypothetical protein